MITFLMLAALLTGLALLSVLPPLLRRVPVMPQLAPIDELNVQVLREQLRELDTELAAGVIDASAYAGARQDLERRVLEEAAGALPSASGSRWAPVALGVALPALAATLYFFLGTPAGLDPAAARRSDEQAHQVSGEQMAGMVDALARRLQGQPGDIAGWTMLARSYNTLGRFKDAVDAYAHLLTLAPGDADLLADYADTLAMTRGKNLAGEPERLIARALAADPNHIKALALAGSAAFERRDYRGALERWQKILTLTAPDSDTARTTAADIGEARRLLDQADDKQAPAAGALAGTVELDPALRAGLADDATVFIFARAANARIPVAVLRRQVKDLPLHFVLDDSMGMVANVKLADFPTLLVGARVSRSGGATPAAGDVEGISGPVHPGASDVAIRIDTRRQ